MIVNFLLTTDTNRARLSASNDSYNLNQAKWKNTMPKKPATVSKEELEKQAGQLVTQNNAALDALFAPSPGLDATLKGLKRMNLPPMIKPGSVPMGATLCAIIVDVVKSPVTTIKGNLLWLDVVTLNADCDAVKIGREVTFPCTGVVRQALVGTGTEGEKDVLNAQLAHKGKLITLKREPDQPSKFKNQMFMFDVRLSDKPVKSLEKTS